MKRELNGDNYDITVSLAEVLTAIVALKEIKEVGEEFEAEYGDTGLLESLQIAIDVMNLFIQEKYNDQFNRLCEELKKIKDEAEEVV